MGLLAIRLPHIASYDFGVGVDRLSGTAMNQAVVAKPSPPTQAGGIRMSFDVTRIKTSEDLQKKLGIDVEASAGCATFGAGASARFGFVNETKVQSACLFMAVTSVVRLADLSIDHAVLTDPAKEVNARPDVFSARYGDMFCRACSRGGIFVGVLRLEVQDAREATELEAELQGSYGAFSAEAKTTFTSSIEKHNARAHFTLYTEGGPELDIDDPFDPEELLDHANDWQKAMRDEAEENAVPYEWTLSPLTIAEGPTPPNAAQLQHAQDVLLFCAHERSDLLDKLNGYNWVNDHAEEYDWTGEVALEQIWQALVNTQDDLDLVSQCASRAINDPTSAVMPAQFAASQSKIYPSTVALALPQKNPAAVGPPVDDLTLTADGRSFPIGFPVTHRDVPDSFEATTQVTVDFGGPVAADFGNVGITRSPRHVGIGIVSSENNSLSGVAMQIEADGRKVGRVSGSIGVDRMFSAQATPFFGDVLHLKIRVKNRHVIGTLFSLDGQEFMPTASKIMVSRNPRLGSPCRLALFAYSMDDSQVVAHFTEPTITPL
ncbi:hypothetical protein ACIBP6_16655 [Nonomuraea terrae]|uniref:hypothetical protein n=1 Tax=Nonomuraea terrae TaxID=2530383 RepID=UPI003788553C